MRRFWVLLIVGLFLGTNGGCFLNQYSSDPVIRGEQLIFQSENLRQIENEWRRIWFNNQPSTMTYERVYGGVGP